MGSEVEGKENPQQLEQIRSKKVRNEEEESYSVHLPNDGDCVEDVTTTFSETDMERAVTEKQDTDDNNKSSSQKSEENHHDNVSANNHANRSAVTDNENNVTNGQEQIIQPHSHLPKPQVPPGISNPPSSTTENDDVSHPNSPVVSMPSIGKFIRQRSNGLSSAIAKRISFFKDDQEKSPPKNQDHQEVTEFNLKGLKVFVKLKSFDETAIKGRISFFSRSNCRDSTAVRRFFREKGLKFVEINIDVYTEREKELRERTESSSVPQIFFNEKLMGGLVALNSLRNSGVFEQRLKEMLSVKCPDNAPAPPAYGFDPPEEDLTDEMVGIVRILRQRLPIQDRLMKMKMKIIKNCFTGTDLVEAVIEHLDCGRKKAVEVGKQLFKKHFIHHVFGENDFVDGNQLYRFLEHEPFISGCFNFCGTTNDSEPKPAASVCQRLTKMMSAILESYASDDRRYVDYSAISKSEEFRRYVIMTQDLQRVNLFELSENEKLAFFLNLYNAMVIHAIIRLGSPETVMDRKHFFYNFQYVVGGLPYSLTAIKDGILRSNRRPPFSLGKAFGSGDRQLEHALVKMNPLIHFGLCNGTKSSPKARFFSTQGVADELRCAAREFFRNGGVEVDLEKRTVYITQIIKWWHVDFGPEKDILKWIINYLDPTQAGFLTHLLGDGGSVNISYQTYDWSIYSSQI